MSGYIPSTRSVMHGYVSTMNRKRDMQPMEAKAAFRSWLVEVERAAAEKAWDEGFSRGFYRGQILSGDYDASEAGISNPYIRQEEVE